MSCNHVSSSLENLGNDLCSAVMRACIGETRQPHIVPGLSKMLCQVQDQCIVSLPVVVQPVLALHIRTLTWLEHHQCCKT